MNFMYELNLSCIKLTIQVLKSFMIRVLLKHFIHVMIKYGCPMGVSTLWPISTLAYKPLLTGFQLTGQYQLQPTKHC